MTEPVRFRLDQSRAGSLLSGILSLKADEFLPGAPSELVGPADPRGGADYRLVVRGGLGTETLELTRLGQQGFWFGHAVERDVWFLAEVRRFAPLIEWPVESLRARWMISQPVDDVAQIAIRVDDSVARVMAGEARVVRRGRF